MKSTQLNSTQSINQSIDRIELIKVRLARVRALSTLQSRLDSVKESRAASGFPAVYGSARPDVNRAVHTISILWGMIIEELRLNSRSRRGNTVRDSMDILLGS